MEVAWIDRKSLFEDRQKLTRYEIWKERIKDVSKTWGLRHLSNWKGIKDLFRESVDLKTRNLKKKRKEKRNHGIGLKSNMSGIIHWK